MGTYRRIRIEIDVGSAMVIERIEEDLRDIYGSRAWLLAVDALPAATNTIRRLRAYGSPRCLAIAARHGVGEPPSAVDCESHVLGLGAMPLMEAIYAAEDALRDLPDEVQAAVDRFDPRHELRVIGAIFSDGRPVAGRPFWGARKLSWRLLEDKLTVDLLWDRVGIEHVLSEVVDLEPAALSAAVARLDLGQGTVWAGDAVRGFHGGATYTCLVRSPADAERARAHLASRCLRARVMPFLEGIPCSIHGIVFAERQPTLVLRPAEMLTLRRPASATGFLYSRMATSWDPPAAIRDQMRAIARRVGDHLAQHHGYRGAFTIDGICTREGFRPTELNPRVGAALGLMVPDFPFSLLHDVIVEGVGRDWDVPALERELLVQADHTRRSAIGFLTSHTLPHLIARPLCWTGACWVDAPEQAHFDAELSIGPGAEGSFVQLKLAPRIVGVHTRSPLVIGASAAPLAKAVVDYVDETFGTLLGPVEAAVDVW